MISETNDGALHCSTICVGDYVLVNSWYLSSRTVGEWEERGRHSLLASFLIPRVTFYKVLLIRRILLVMRPKTIKNMSLNLAIRQISVLRRLDFDVKEVGAPVCRTGFKSFQLQRVCKPFLSLYVTKVWLDSCLTVTF